MLGWEPGGGGLGGLTLFPVPHARDWCVVHKARERLPLVPTAGLGRAKLRRASGTLEKRQWASKHGCCPLTPVPLAAASWSRGNNLTRRCPQSARSWRPGNVLSSASPQLSLGTHATETPRAGDKSCFHSPGWMRPHCSQRA